MFSKLQTTLHRAFGGEETSEFQKLGDFTCTPRLIWIALLALPIGYVSAWLALFLLRLIGLFTNLFFYQRWSWAITSPVGNRLGAWEIVVPIIGALIVGFMARYGSERIRGHGIPEAIEAILINGSRVEPKVAILKPLSSAISIGSGGPFGAEGPIIMTAGAFGSLIAQVFRLSSAERKTLLVAGAAGGMSATFAAPVAAALLAVELLLFEWKPRSLIPVALASVTACATRWSLLGLGPLFPSPAHPAYIGLLGLGGCVVAGLLAGALSTLLTAAVYASEDFFLKIPVHWMWWPAAGGLVIGIGGLIFPQALGTGYPTIAALLQGEVARNALLGILLVKSVMWSVSLGSGTSGGVLAPLLMMGGALGGVEASFLPFEGIGFWPLLGMGAILGGTMRSPFTGVIFMLELTHDINMLLPLLLAVALAHGFSVLTLRRSILTEKVARRGFHLSREYAVDPLELLFARDAMRKNIVALSAETQCDAANEALTPKPERRGQHLYPVVDIEQRLAGVITRRDLKKIESGCNGQRLVDVARKNPVVAYASEPLRAVAYRMAETGFTRLPVVTVDDNKLVGMISLRDLLLARTQSLDQERHRERLLRIHLPFAARAPVTRP